eukprot:CAMPEP_0119270176 /NCGR_PEP_ID=MMETSP1329-20130426/7286_1 /TAXON_ID=114041 /ORGANISM="Genus nov. species nov., Strain RCC1024" /LENGTH=95 /DNA_ID=CAMNT_0007270187 /DNA_START=260 /DNA_END=544 /DNA_ORIENTATION=+
MASPALHATLAAACAATAAAGIPQPVVHGTSVFLSIVVALTIMTLFAMCLGVCSKDNTQIAIVLYSLAGFCCWLLWLCTWMHQWHPLLVPIYNDG